MEIDSPDRGGGIEIVWSDLRGESARAPHGLGGGIWGLAAGPVEFVKEMGVEPLTFVPGFVTDWSVTLPRAAERSAGWGSGASCIRITVWGGPAEPPGFSPGVPAWGPLMSGPAAGRPGAGGGAKGEPL